MAYDHQAIERRWQQHWDEQQTFKAERRAGRPKFYVLDMFPYPSGTGLHVGHPLGYVATDIVARYKRMRGFDVLHPMGWDAFGLPAEQHAMATGTHPSLTIAKSVEIFRRQLKSLGLSYDWSREVNTTDPEYFKWTQWIFLQLFKRGLAFQAEIPVNWCPALGTVLANEEVIDGKSERGGHPVVRQPLRQWQLRITAYADRLSEDLEGLDWPETKQKQRDWIGRSEGAEVEFRVAGPGGSLGETLRVYTTRPDTLYGATYMVIAPDHPLTLSITVESERQAVAAYAAQTARKSDLERTALSKQKSGVFTGVYALNPLTQLQIPIYTADYVLGAYGTGAIMAVPAHDTRDFEFAKQFGLPIVEVVSPDGQLHESLGEAFVEEGSAVRSGPFDGLSSAEFKKRVIEHLEQSGIGQRKVNYKLRDWVFSRQRYWGEPVPIYFPVKTAGDPRTGAAYEIDYTTPIACDESELPLRLPELDDYRPGEPDGPLARALAWRFFEKDGKFVARETNTMPQWAGSCWYYLRFLDPHNTERLCSEEAYRNWMPVDLYVGGSEHAVLHLLYARFWHKVLYDIGVVKDAEPFAKLVHQGMILGQAFKFYLERDAEERIVRAFDGHLDSTEALRAVEQNSPGGRLETGSFTGQPEWRDGKPYHPEYGVPLAIVTEKMSKSRGNVVNPDEVVTEFGADSLRVYQMFMGPLDQAKPWQTSGIQGSRRFLDKAHALAGRVSAANLEPQTLRLMHQTIKKVTLDIEALHFNTAVSQMMIFVNHLSGLAQVPRAAFEGLVLCLSPFAPHLAAELWQGLGHAKGIEFEPWPAYDETLCVEDVIELPVQVNGRVRGKVRVARDAGEESVRQTALDDSVVRGYLAGKSVRKVVYVKGRILNLIVDE